MNLVPLKIFLFLSMLVSAVVANDAEKAKSVIAPPILKMNAPKLWEGDKLNIGSLNVPISSNDELVRKHVRQGFLLIHAQWDLEAYRHFAAALQRDPDCLMAYCGVVLSLIHPEHEWKEYRSRAINRMVTLAEHKNGEGDDAEFTFPRNERDYALAIGSLVVNGLDAGAASFTLLKDRYPNDLQLSLIAPFLNRGGYNVFGNPSTKQEVALEEVKKVLDKNPKNPMVLNFYVMMQVEAPYNAIDQRTQILPYAKRLVEIGGAEFPGWQFSLGYAAWRSGEMELARDAFQKAVSLYEKWKADSGATISECDALIRSYSFLSVVHYQMGNKKLAAQALAKIEQAKSARKTSPVYVYYSWRYEMTRVSMSLADVAVGDTVALKKMLKELPKIKSGDSTKGVFNKVIKGYQAYGLAREYHFSGKVEKSNEMNVVLTRIGNELTRDQNDYRTEPFFGHYLVLMQSLKVYRYEFLAELAGDEGAFGFYHEAIDKQLLPNRYFPPSILYPMEYKLGQYYERKGDLKNARETYLIATQRMPSHQASQKAYAALVQLLED